MEIKIAAEILNNETAQITLPGRSSTNGSWLTEKINRREDVLIYIADRAEKWARGENSFQDAERQMKNEICTRRCLREKELLRVSALQKGCGSGARRARAALRGQVWKLLQGASGENDVLRGIH